MPRTKPKAPAKGRGRLGSGSFARDATIDDIPQDDLDAFEAGRDSILLDGEEAGRDADDIDMLGNDYDREVLRVDDAAQHEDSEEDDEEDSEDVDEDEDDEKQAYDHLRSKPSGKKGAAPAISDDSDDDDDDDEEDDEDELHINDRGWGPNKRAYYNTNNLDDIESDSDMDEEQARELELKEVKRLQRKSRSTMDDADFGLGDEEVDGGLGKALRDAGRAKRRKELDEDEAPSTEVRLAPSSAADPQPGAVAEATASSDADSRQALLAKLQRISPETVALAGEYADTMEDFVKVDAMLKKLMAEKPGQSGLELVHLHHQTLITYLTTITFYFHLRASPEFAANPAKLAAHPVLLRMMKLKQGLSAMEELGITADRPPASDDDEDDEGLDGLEEDELAGLLADEEEMEARNRSRAKVGASKSKKPQSEPDAGVEYAKAPKVKKAKRADKGDSGKTEAKADKKSKKADTSAEPAPLAAGLTDLDDEPVPEFKIKASKKSKGGATPNPFAMSQYDSEAEASTSFGEPTQLAAFESAEKDAKRRSLQFHASAIETKGSQRSKAARDRLAGDMDIPYRDRERSRMAVEAAKAARQQKVLQISKDTALDEGWGDNDDRDWRDVMGVDTGGHGASAGGDDGDAEDYYDLIASGKKAAKKAKKEAYEAMRDEERFVPEETVEPGGHRGINRTIEKNKGLAPKRKKVARNPRVKKRQKYEQAKKKLSSRQAVFKGGQASLQGGYGGEQSGISSHLVRSRKLG
ncbi:something about silencing protein 10 [Thecaphora frezii]